MFGVVAEEVPVARREPLVLVFWETDPCSETGNSSEGLWIGLGEQEA